MSLLSKDQILAAPDVPVLEVPTPEWGGSVRIRGLDALSFIRLVESLKDETDALTRLKLLALQLVDESGEALFTFEELEQIGKKSWEVVRRLSDICIELNGGGKEAAAKLKENFPMRPGADLPSG